jgi:hypothetical protein
MFGEFTMGKTIRVICGLITMGLIFVAVQVRAESPRVYVPESRHEFAPVVEGVLVQHDFVVRNNGTADLNIADVHGG